MAAKKELKRKAKRILIHTENGHFKQWILYPDGQAEYGAIGKTQQSTWGNDSKADAKLKKGYTELTPKQYETFMKGYRNLCKFKHLAMAKLADEEIELELEKELDLDDIGRMIL